jgi:anti-sigma regulatory factor (Ser/Thr protein kinase)
MKLVLGAMHAVFPMSDASRVGEARRHAAQLAALAGLDETAAGRLAIVVNELGNNLVRHAHEGRLLLMAREDSGEVELLSIDNGPGIPDVARSLGDGYSTGGTPGTGLGAVQRQAQDFELHSAVGEGTVIVARVRNAGAAPAEAHAVRCAGISIAKPGEVVCGDAWAAGLNGTRGALIVADGLGHGPDAAEASEAAVEVFSHEPLAQPRVLLERLHNVLRSTRGAAVSLVQLDSAADCIRFAGAGNVVARVISGVSDRSLLVQHGTVGLQMRRPEESSMTWPPHALLVMYSDGIETRWSVDRLMPVLGRDPSLVAAILLRDHCRGRDDATVVVMRREDAR